jgi:quercetin dioxygenase-like cupin family protein
LSREIVCPDLNAALDHWRGEGFRLDSINPADDPHTARLSRGGERLRLTTRPGSLPPGAMPLFKPEFLLTRAQQAPVQGRAGMLYRDLIPGRLGGRYVASHITIPEGGPVSDWVHYHRVSLQLILVRRGWVRVVYEDQGPPFVMNEGDLILQPPLIRHRVLESSAGLEVIEISTPALHETFADHELALPNAENRSREFGGQRFLRHLADGTPWTPFRGAEQQQSDLLDATAGLADARVVRAAAATQIEIPSHDGELVFGGVLEGNALLNGKPLQAADAFVVPPGEPWTVSAMTSNFRLLHVTTARLD